MPSQDSKSWLLGAGYIWRTLESSQIKDDPKGGLSLVAKRPYEPPTFVVKACPAPSYEFGGTTYEIDRQKHEVRAYTAQGKLRHRWGSRDDEGGHVAPTDPRAWDPIDIVGDNSCVFLLDQRYQAIYAHGHGREALSLVFKSQKPGSMWSRLAMDESGCLLIFDKKQFDTKQKEALVYDRRGQYLGKRKANWPSSPASPCDWLSYKINRQDREVRVYGAGEKLLYVWRARDESGNHVSGSDPRAWDPVDIVGDESGTYFLDQRYQIIYSHQYGRQSLSLLCQSNKPGSRWSRMGIDNAGWLMIFDAGEHEALLYDRLGQFRGTRSANWPAAPPTDADTQSNATTGETDSDGLSYPREGAWLSQPLDSSVYNCQWHCIRMAIKRLPPGTEVEVKTFAYQRKDLAPLRSTDPRFVTANHLVAPTQPSPSDRSKKRSEEFLVQSGPGQYLSVAIHLRGDGFDTAVIEGLRVQYPRESYLEYLPPLYSADEPMRSFLDRFLSIFQAEWDELDRRVEESEAFFDPDAVPEGDAMTYLASWLGLELEGTWNAKQNRQLLRAVPKIYPRRGTVKALRDYVGIYLANIAGLTFQQVAESPFPAIVEGFQERQYLMLSQDAASTLGSGKPLWSAGVVKRLQLGVFSRAGDVELVSTGDPERDLFHHFAHRFRIYAPAAWVRTAEQEQLLRRSIEAEMPAHVSYELCLVEAGLRVDIQSTVGLDTIVGDPPAMRLSCEPEKEAFSLPARNQLGLGAVLTGKGRGPTVLDRNARVGSWILN